MLAAEGVFVDAAAGRVGLGAMTLTPFGFAGAGVGANTCGAAISAEGAAAAGSETSCLVLSATRGTGVDSMVPKLKQLAPKGSVGRGKQ